MPGIRRASTLIRLAALAAAAVLMAGACAANQAAPDIPLGQNGALATAVPDGPFDAGRGASVVLDPSGDPEVSYILLQPKLKTGEIAPPPVIGQPSPPSVVLAALSQGRWSRTAVTGLPTVGSNDRGNATGIAAKNDLPGPVVSTALAIDPQGKHHVAWSATDGLYYDTDATGSFGSPQKVVKTTTLGASLALAPDGTPWISFYEGSDVKVAHFVGGKWQIQTVGPATVPTAAATTAVRASSTGAFVGFGSGDTTMVGVQTGGRAGWTAESVPGPGGFGVSMALESKGVPSVAYYDSSGVVHLATRSGKATWSAQDVATTKAGPDARWGTGIAVDDHGVHALTYLDMKTGEVFLATDKSGGFTSTPVPNSVGGATPAIAVSTDGTNLAVAFFDTVNANLVVATP
ncbi:MAG TPA: hypothetical protein VF972_05705, partial [Actinomycetota bacterium]